MVHRLRARRSSKVIFPRAAHTRSGNSNPPPSYEEAIADPGCSTTTRVSSFQNITSSQSHADDTEALISIKEANAYIRELKEINMYHMQSITSLAQIVSRLGSYRKSHSNRDNTTAGDLNLELQRKEMELDLKEQRLHNWETKLAARELLLNEWECISET
ncbi:hypothetical protein BJ508DRAFT_316093 [Ascobolus immersus RN42]|uniref:Uncharacterized protein n=1 Tax=Ascobolus immersus RN42 TaxID=1160509 RepID=A0A3N4HC24_ASCIM|nr:hypothetical protein BJ508DRAFT_316093 [Ascobolus immersus RN42]